MNEEEAVGEAEIFAHWEEIHIIHIKRKQDEHNENDNEKGPHGVEQLRLL